MARGQQKVQARQKAEAKQAKQKKSHDAKSQMKSAQAALVYTCRVCRTQTPDVKTFRQHFESKHPSSPLPPELQGE